MVCCVVFLIVVLHYKYCNFINSVSRSSSVGIYTHHLWHPPTFLVFSVIVNTLDECLIVPIHTSFELYLQKPTTKNPNRSLTKCEKRFCECLTIFYNTYFFYFRDAYLKCISLWKAHKICIRWTFHLFRIYFLYKSKGNGVFYG